MRIIIQRVRNASVTIDEKLYSSIEQGMMILVGIEETDNDEDIAFLTKKVVNMRIFDDADGIMNRSVIDIDGEILVVSQFTLHASTKKGNRPSYIKAAKPHLVSHQGCKVPFRTLRRNVVLFLRRHSSKGLILG